MCCSTDNQANATHAPKARQQGAVLRSCKSSTSLPLPLPSHVLKSDPDPVDSPQSLEYQQPQARAISTPNLHTGIPRDPRFHQGNRSCGCPSQEDRVQTEHSAPQSDNDPAREALVRGCPQNSCLQVCVKNTSGPKNFQGPCRFSRHQHQSSKPYWSNNTKNRLNARDPGQGTATAASRWRGENMNTQPYGWKPPHAPRMRPVPLPLVQEGGQYPSNTGPGMKLGSTEKVGMYRVTWVYPGMYVRPWYYGPVMFVVGPPC